MATYMKSRAATTAGTVVIRRPSAVEADPVRFFKRRRVLDLCLRIGGPILLIGFWQVAAVNEFVIDRKFFPAPTDTIRAFRRSIDSGLLQESARISAERIGYGFVLGSAAGLLFGLALGVNRWLRVALDGTLSALYTVPKLALLPLLLVIFGLGDGPKIILIAMSCFFIVAISTIESVVSIPTSVFEPIRSCGAGRLQIFRHVTLPTILPALFVSLRLAIGSAVIVLVGIEFVQGGEGLGWMIWNSWQVFNVGRMYVGIVTVAVIGVLFQLAIQLLGRALTPWTEKQ